MNLTFPGESAEYRAARQSLLEDETQLRRDTERVARARRELPPGGKLPQDYVFQGSGPDGQPTDIRFSELFAPGKDSLVLYAYMFPRHCGDDRRAAPGDTFAEAPLEEHPCPSCTALLDQLDGAAEHVGQRLNLAAVAEAPIEKVLAFARERDWRHLRLLSSHGNTFKRHYHSEDADGNQMPLLHSFHRTGAEIRHVWSSEMFYEPTDPGQDPRHVGTLEPLWNLFDFTVEGRPDDWHEQLSYT